MLKSGCGHGHHDLAYYTVDKPVSPDELGRILRPVNGLTPEAGGSSGALPESLIAGALCRKRLTIR